MGNIQDSCCNSDKDQNTILSKTQNKHNKNDQTSSAVVAEAKKIQAANTDVNKSASNFSDQAFQNIFKNDTKAQGEAPPGSQSPVKGHHVGFAIENNHPALRKKSTLHGEILAGARPKLNSIIVEVNPPHIISQKLKFDFSNTIGFSMHAHNFPVSGNILSSNGNGAQRKLSLRKRSKLHSMKPQHFEILSEKQNASEEEAKSHSQNPQPPLELITQENLQDDCQTSKQAKSNLSDQEKELLRSDANTGMTIPKINFTQRLLVKMHLNLRYSRSSKFWKEWSRHQCDISGERKHKIKQRPVKQYQTKYSLQ